MKIIYESFWNRYELLICFRLFTLNHRNNYAWNDNQYKVFNLDVSGEPMKERIAVLGPLGIVKRSLDLGCTNVVASNTDINKNNIADGTASATTGVTGLLQGRKMIPPTTEEIRRMMAVGGW